MLGYKPNQDIWKRVNLAILDENAAEVTVTLISGMCSMLIASGACSNERSARVQLAAMLLSPDTGPVGSLLPDLTVELAKLRADGGKWIT
jgi:hypothetical protein